MLHLSNDAVRLWVRNESSYEDVQNLLHLGYTVLYRCPPYLLQYKSTLFSRPVLGIFKRKRCIASFKEQINLGWPDPVNTFKPHIASSEKTSLPMFVLLLGGLHECWKQDPSRPLFRDFSGGGEPKQKKDNKLVIHTVRILSMSCPLTPKKADCL